jgi:hypothetical protein
VVASSTPITPDPPTRPRINSSPASADPEAIEELRKRFLARGIDAETAQAMAEQHVLDNKQGEIDRLDAPGKARQARQQQAAAAEHQRKIDSGYVPTTNPDGSVSYQMAPDMEPLTAQELRGRKQNPLSEPGPRTLDGSPITPPRQFRTEREARDYNTRTQVTDDNRKGRRSSDAAYLPSERDQDMEKRGFFAVTNPDGSVSYSVGTGYYEEGNPRTSDDADEGRQIPGGLGRLGPRADLEPGFDLQEVRGPNGTVSVYRQNDESKAKQAAYMGRQQVSRIARATGLDENELSAMTPEQRTMALNRSRSQDFNARNATWKAQAMLAGGRPTGGIGGSKALTNAWLSLPEDQRDDAMRYMLPGGALSASVDARQLEQAAALAGKSILGAFATNPGAIGMQQTQQTAAESALPVEAHADVERKRNKGVLPASSAAGQRMLKKIGEDKIGPYATVSEVDDAVQAAVDAGIDRKEAEQYYAPRRRSFPEWAGFGGSPAAGPPAAPGAAPGTPAPPPGSDPRAWGGGA